MSRKETLLRSLEAMGRAMGVDVDAILGRGTIGRQQCAKLLYAVADHPPEEIRRAARQAFRSAFGRDLEKVTIETTKSNPTWRH